MFTNGPAGENFEGQRALGQGAVEFRVVQVVVELFGKVGVKAADSPRGQRRRIRNVVVIGAANAFEITRGVEALKSYMEYALQPPSPDKGHLKFEPK